jgi:hypothetical protein
MRSPSWGADGPNVTIIRIQFSRGVGLNRRALLSCFAAWLSVVCFHATVAAQHGAPIGSGQIANLQPPELGLSDPILTSDLPTNSLTDQQWDAIDQRLQERLDGQANLKPGLQFGYQNGFTITSPEGIKIAGGVPFSMRLNSWFQFRHTGLASHRAGQNQNDFEFERLRVTLQGTAYTPDLTYFVQFDGDDDQGQVSDWLDYYISYDFGHAMGLKPGRLGFRLGQWKLPFNRTRAESGWKLQFTDRAMASVFFDINRSRAIGLYGDFGWLGRTVKWETALSNGFKTGGFLPTRRDLDRHFGVSGRLWSDWWGEWGSDGESDLSYHDTPAIRVGGGFASTRLNAGTRESLRQRAVDSGVLLDSILPAGVDRYDLGYYAVDANGKYRGWSVLSEYYFRTLSHFRGAAVEDLFDHGFLLQTGKFVVPGKLELLVRWSRIVGDSGTLGQRDQSADEVAGGFVWYMKGHRAKFTFDVTRLNGTPIRDLALNILPGDDGMLYRSQFQLYF